MMASAVDPQWVGTSCGSALELAVGWDFAVAEPALQQKLTSALRGLHWEYGRASSTER